MSKPALQVLVQCGKYDSYKSNYNTVDCCTNSCRSHIDTTCCRYLEAGERFLFGVVKKGSKEMAFKLNLEGKTDLEERHSR